jgi:4-hydroxymandelate oxidase
MGILFAAVLPRIVDALAGEMAVLVPSGILRGTDVLKAIAPGANVVLIGRPFIFGLANVGAVGVAHVLRKLRDELEITMALCGCATLAQASRALFFDYRS